MFAVTVMDSALAALHTKSAGKTSERNTRRIALLLSRLVDTKVSQCVLLTGAAKTFHSHDPCKCPPTVAAQFNIYQRLSACHLPMVPLDFSWAMISVFTAVV
jgi:hypothetical protein